MLRFSRNKIFERITYCFVSLSWASYYNLSEYLYKKPEYSSFCTNYRPQVILFTGRGCLPGGGLWQTPPGQNTSLGRYPPPVHAGIHTPWPVHAGIQPHCPVHAGIHAPPPLGHCSGRYASYWNAFLFVNLSFP